MSKKNLCPDCGSEEFISNPNQYDVLVFDSGNFDILHTENIDDENIIYCRECGEEIDEKASNKAKRVVLKTKAVAGRASTENEQNGP